MLIHARKRKQTDLALAVSLYTLILALSILARGCALVYTVGSQGVFGLFGRGVAHLGIVVPILVFRTLTTTIKGSCLNREPIFIWGGESHRVRRFG